MLSPSRLFSPLNKNILRPVYLRLLSQTANDDDFFKFYSDSGPSDVGHGPLTEVEYRRFISKRSSLREPALTRQITSLAYKVGKEFISLAEGMPNEDIFPFTKISLQLRDGSELVINGKEMAAALQYMPTQGMPQLLKLLRDFQQDLHRPPGGVSRDLLVTSGGQFGLYSCVELLLEPHAPILLPGHAYTGMYSVLKPYQPEIIGIPEDEDGINPEYLESTLEDRLKKRLPMPRFIYLVPTGSNPSGTVIPEQRRRKIYELACTYDFLILEDDPYMFMNYTNKSVPSFLSLDTCGRVIRIDSLSKVLSPGLRTGWVTAPAPLLSRLELHLQADHLHASTLGQAILHKVFSNRQSLAKQLRSAHVHHHARRDALGVALAEHCSALATWREPSAGMFYWIKLRVHDVYQMVFKTAFEKGLMLIPGHACTYDSSAPSPYLRLAFSKVRLEDMDLAARLLADVIRTEQKACDSETEKVATRH